MSFESATLSNYGQFDIPDNRVGVAQGTAVTGSSLLTCEAEHVGSSTSTPSVIWIRNGVLIMDDGNYKSNTTAIDEN